MLTSLLLTTKLHDQYRILTIPMNYRQQFEVVEGCCSSDDEGSFEKRKYPKCPTYLAANPYDGCEHNCAYCITTHDGKTPSNLVKAKVNFVEALRQRLKSSPNGGRQVPVYLSPWTDAYQQAEARFGLTRQIIEMLIEERVPFFIVTKSDLVSRDLDLMSREGVACNVCMSVISTDDSMRQMLEPGTPPAESRFNAMSEIAGAQIRTILKIDPIVPGITDSSENLRRIIEKAAQSGTKHVTAEILRLTPVLWEYMQQALPGEMLERIKTAYFSQEGHALNEAEGNIYIPDEERKRMLTMVRNMAQSKGMTFSTCAYRGGLNLNDGVCLGTKFE